jgi:hypothetical protein
LAVRPFILTYEILQNRRNLPRIDNEDDAPSLTWERLLQEKMGCLTWTSQGTRSGSADSPAVIEGGIDEISRSQLHQPCL